MCHLPFQTHPTGSDGPKMFGGKCKSWSSCFLQCCTVLHKPKDPNFKSEYIPKFAFLLRYCVVFQYIGTELHNGSLLAVVTVCISVALLFPLLMYHNVSITTVWIVCKKLGVLSVWPPSSFHRN
jgi:hypothetical protein